MRPATRTKIKVLLDFFQKIAVSKGRAFGRASQGAKFPPAAAGETPAPRTARKPLSSEAPSADGATPGRRPWPPPPPLRGGRRGPFCTVPSAAVVCIGAQSEPSAGGGTHRCRPTNTDGLPTWSVGRDLRVPPPVQAIDTRCTDGFHSVGRGLAPAAVPHCRPSPA